MSSTANGWTWEESRTNTPPLDFTAMKYVNQRLYSLDASLHGGTALSTTGRDVLYSGSGTGVGSSAGVPSTASWCCAAQGVGSPPSRGHRHTYITHLLIVDLWSRTVPAFVR